jgi:hypothetical protein
MGCVAVTVMVLGGRPGWACEMPANIRSIAVTNKPSNKPLFDFIVFIFYYLGHLPHHFSVIKIYL